MHTHWLCAKSRSSCTHTHIGCVLHAVAAAAVVRVNSSCVCILYVVGCTG